MTYFFTHPDGRVFVVKGTWHSSEPDVGIMHDYFEVDQVVTDPEGKPVKYSEEIDDFIESQLDKIEPPSGEEQ